MANYIDKAALVGERLTSSEQQLRFREMTGTEAYYEFLRLVNDTPAAEVEPVRHARWIPEENGDVYFSCSYCGCEISTSWDYNDLEWNFCPECGCRMDLGGADNGE